MGPPLSVPGVRFSYSDTAYVIIGEILERISGKGLAAVLREELDFGGRGLSVTHFERYEACPKGLMFAPQRLGSLDIMMIDASADLFGGGGIISTTGEIAAFFRAVFRGEFFDKPETLAAGLMTPTVEPAPGEELHSVLARSRVLDGERGWAHGGFWGLGGLYLPASDIAIAMAYNQVEAGESTRGGVGIPGFTDRIGAILHRAAREFQVG
jgi:D-alanyl-D-alanine carboxypeptidase